MVEKLLSQIDPTLFKLAESVAQGVAKQSPCTRRKYGAVIIRTENNNLRDNISASNERVSRCCNDTCARTDASLLHGKGVEVGAEIHAETAALIKAGPKKPGDKFLLIGYFASGRELYGENVYPCHVCALNLKFAGYNYIYIKTEPDNIAPVSVSEIIEYREAQWNDSD